MGVIRVATKKKKCKMYLTGVCWKMQMLIVQITFQQSGVAIPVSRKHNINMIFTMFCIFLV